MIKLVDNTNVRWIREFHKQILRRQHIILHGNIHDLFLWGNTYQNIQEILKSYFLDLKFDLVVSYDNIEKFQCAKPEMTELFDELARRRNLETDQLIEESFMQILGSLSQPTKSVAVKVELGDMLASNSISKSTERDPLIMLKKSTLEASLIADGSLKGYRNTLVILVNELKTVPQWFYLKNPFVQIVEVSLPSKEERRQFAINFFVPAANGINGFYGGDRIKVNRLTSQEPSELEVLAEEFADLTEEFKTWDLETLRNTSWQRKMPLEAKKICRLVNFYKFGEQEDPWEKLSPDKLKRARKELSLMVIGQERAINAVTTMLISARVGLNTSGNTKPKGVFFFVGPTGVGKTELAKAMTKLLFGNEEALARFDMSEYREENADQRLIGAPPGYTGYEKGGQLTNRVINYPYSILLFDEIEKAHPKILDKFLQILEDGRLTDGKGQTAYFNQTAIIFTSNIGASDLMNRVKDGGIFGYEELKAHFRAKVDWHFISHIGRAELLSRLGRDNIVVFDLLRSQFVSMIGKKLLLKLAEVTEEKYKLILKFKPSVYSVLSKRMGEGDNLLFGGRGIKTELESLVERPLNVWIFYNFPNTSKLAGLTLELGLTSDRKLEIISNPLTSEL